MSFAAVAIGGVATVGAAAASSALQPRAKTGSSLSKQQKGISQDVWDYLHGKIGVDLQQYPTSKLVAPLLPGMVQAMGMAGTYNPSLFAKSAPGAIERALSGKPSFSLDPSVTQNYFQNSFVSPMMRTWNSVIKPQINEAYAAQGAGLGSRRASAIDRSLGDLTSNLTQQLGQLSYQDQALGANLAESAAQRSLSAVPVAQQYQMQPLMASSAMSSALAPFQAWSQQQSTDTYNEFLRTRSYNSPFLNAALSFLGTPQTTTYQQQSNPWLAGGLQGAGFAGRAGLFGGGIQQILGGTPSPAPAYIGQNSFTGSNFLGTTSDGTKFSYNA